MELALVELGCINFVVENNHYPLLERTLLILLPPICQYVNHYVTSNISENDIQY